MFSCIEKIKELDPCPLKLITEFDNMLFFFYRPKGQERYVEIEMLKSTAIAPSPPAKLKCSPYTRNPIAVPQTGSNKAVMEAAEAEI